MALRPEHELHRRRRGRNMGLGLVLGLFVALVFGLSIVKISQGDLMEAFDHQPRASVLPIDPSAPGRMGNRPAALPGAAAPAGPAGTPEGTTP